MTDNPEIDPPPPRPSTHNQLHNKLSQKPPSNFSFPKKDQAITFNTIQDVTQIEYIKAFSLLTSPNNIKFAITHFE